MTKLVNAIIESYIKVMGEAKWNSLSAEQQHDAIMIIVKDMNKALDKVEELAK